MLPCSDPLGTRDDVLLLSKAGASPPYVAQRNQPFGANFGAKKAL